MKHESLTSGALIFLATNLLNKTYIIIFKNKSNINFKRIKILNVRLYLEI